MVFPGNRTADKGPDSTPQNFPSGQATDKGGRIVETLLGAFLMSIGIGVLVLLFGAATGHCETAYLPLSVIVDEPVNMPRKLIAHTVVVKGLCVLTFTHESVKRRDVVAHEICHCALDADVLGPYGYEGITEQEQKQREARVIQCARRLR